MSTATPATVTPNAGRQAARQIGRSMLRPLGAVSKARATLVSSLTGGSDGKVP